METSSVRLKNITQMKNMEENWQSIIIVMKQCLIIIEKQHMFKKIGLMKVVKSRQKKT